ncbi:MAG: hypothetical protein HY600_05295 [Candidatus Omnitrophica bacterium]|nr:hypothetical protein [Candidatus Omnitrophota bacterium]
MPPCRWPHHLLAAALAVAISPTPAWALRQSQETERSNALATALTVPPGPRAGMEEAEASETPAPLQQLAEALKAHGITGMRWDIDVPQDPALLNQVARWLQAPATPMEQAVERIRQRYAVPLGWGVELWPTENPNEVFVGVPPAGGDQHWVDFASGSSNNWMEDFLHRVREAQATKIWVNAKGAFYQNTNTDRGQFHQMMPPDGLRQFLEDRDLELSLLIQHDDREAWNDMRWLFDPRTARRNVPLHVAVLMSPDGPRIRPFRPQGRLDHLQAYWTRPPNSRLPAQLTILSTNYRVMAPTFLRAVPAIRLDWEGPSGARRYAVNLREFPRRHPARQLIELLAARHTGHVGILGGGTLSLLTGAGTDDLDLVPLDDTEQAQGYEGIGEDSEEWVRFLAALTPVVTMLRRDELITQADVQASLRALVQGQLRFEQIPVATRGMFMVAETGAPRQANLLPARLTVETLLLRPNVGHRDTAWLYDPYGGVEDLLAQRPRIVGHHELFSRGDFAHRGMQAPIHRLFQILRRVVSHRLNVDWTPSRSDEALIPLVHDTLVTWRSWLEAHPPGPADIDTVRAELEYFFRHVAPMASEAERLLEEFGLLEEANGARRTGPPPLLWEWFRLTRSEVERIIERVANGPVAPVMAERQRPTDVLGRLDEQLSKLLHPTEVQWLRELYPRYQQERRLVGPVFHTREAYPGRTFLVALFPYNAPERGPVLRVFIPHALHQYYLGHRRGSLLPEDIYAPSFHESDALPDAAVVMLRLDDHQLKPPGGAGPVSDEDRQFVSTAFQSAIANYLQPSGPAAPPPQSAGLEEGGGRVVGRLQDRLGPGKAHAGAVVILPPESLAAPDEWFPTIHVYAMAANGAPSDPARQWDWEEAVKELVAARPDFAVEGHPGFGAPATPALLIRQTGTVWTTPFPGPILVVETLEALTRYTADDLRRLALTDALKGLDVKALVVFTDEDQRRRLAAFL